MGDVRTSKDWDVKLGYDREQWLLGAIVRKVRVETEISGHQWQQNDLTIVLHNLLLASLIGATLCAFLWHLFESVWCLLKTSWADKQVRQNLYPLWAKSGHHYMLPIKPRRQTYRHLSPKRMRHHGHVPSRKPPPTYHNTHRRGISIDVPLGKSDFLSSQIIGSKFLSSKDIFRS